LPQDAFRSEGLDCLGDLDRHEPVGRVEVILPTLIDHPNVAVLLGVWICHEHVDLVALEGCLVAFILHTHGKTSGGLCLDNHG
jgi:hypothetical protein